MTAYDLRFRRNVEALTTFIQAKGTCAVPKDLLVADPDDPDGTLELGRWVTYVRARHAKGLLTAERAAQLEATPGWTWETRRPGPPPKGARNQAIRDLRATGASLEIVAEAFGISKQRVYQIISRAA